jgi:Trypsin-like peptidase domain
MAQGPIDSRLLAHLVSLQNKLDVGGLASLLGGQREHLRSGLDDRITSALGFTSPSAFLSSLTAQAGGAAERVGSGVTRVGRTARPPRPSIASPPPFRFSGSRGSGGALAALALLAWVLFQNWPSTTRTAMKSVDLPGGRRIEVAAGGFLDSLTSFLKGGSITSPRSFTFDDLQYETGSATLSGASKTQLALLGLELTATDGIVSAPLRRSPGGRASLQITAPIFGGSSGGPVLSAQGKVIGIARSFHRDAQSLTFATPINAMKPLLAAKSRVALPFPSAARATP